jgi:tetratricopeptide (TPR) repeat protein
MLSNYAVSDRSRYFIARDYVENVLRSVEPGGMVLTGDWQLYSPSLYVRDIVGERKDTTIIDVRLLRRSWYFNYLDQAYPQLAGASRGEINTFLEDLSGFDRDPDIYEKNVAMNTRINERFETLISSLITNHLRSGNVYVTLELAAGGGQEPGLKKALGDKYELIPEGIVFRISEKTEPKDLKVPTLELRGLNDGTVKFGEDDVAKRTVIPIYVNMLTNTGSYLASRGQYQRAIELFNQALEIEPTFEPAKRSLAAARNSVPR